ncbi:MAG: DinB family protein [Candidatus Limnocylindria bacterium]
MTPTVDASLFLLEEAFEGRGIEEADESQALMTNLATVSEAEWRTLPSGASRTIESMVLHVAGCKIMYADYAFGAGTKQWGTPEVEGLWQTGAAPMAEAIAWLREAHRSFRGHDEGLTDDDLEQPRMTNGGELRPTRWIVAAIIGHDFYHAGEINHLRSMLGTDDRWRWQQLDGPA